MRVPRLRHIVPSKLGSRSPITALSCLIAREYIASALSRLKPAANCTPHSRSAPSFTCCSTSETNGLGARLSRPITSRHLEVAPRPTLFPSLFPFLPPLPPPPP